MNRMLRILLLTFILGAAWIGCGDGKPTDEADDFYGEASKAYAAAEADRALDLVSRAIEQKPTAWAYTLRARIYAEKKDFGKATEDTTKGLALDPNNRDLKWLETELQKPEAQRFQGAGKQPPSATK